MNEVLLSRNAAARKARIGSILLLIAALFVTYPWLRIAGRTIVKGDLEEWGGFIGLPTCRPQGIAIHHTASDVHAGSVVDIKSLNAWHRARGFGTMFRGRVYYIGYHYIVLPNGEIQAGRPEQCQGAHLGDRVLNREYLGIVLVGNFHADPALEQRTAPEPSQAQLAALRRLLLELVTRHRIDPERIRRHSDLSRNTVCPGTGVALEALRAELVIQRAIEAGQ